MHNYQSHSCLESASAYRRLAVLAASASIAGFFFAADASAAIVNYKQTAPTPFVGGAYLGTQDTFITSNDLGFAFSEDDNYGARGEVFFGSIATGPTISGQQAPRHGLMKFDVSTLAGQYSSVNSVTLRFYVAAFPAIAGTGELYRLANANAAWVEGNGTSGNGFGPEDVGGSTYNFRVQGASSFTGTPWAGSDGADLANTDYLTPSLATAPLPASAPLGTVVDFTISSAATATSLINAWTTGVNAGLFLKTANSANGAQYGFFSSEEINVGAFQPELIVDFVPIPEPASLTSAAFGLIGLAVCRRFRR